MQYFETEEERDLFFQIWNEITNTKKELKSKYLPSIIRKCPINEADVARANCLLYFKHFGILEDSDMYQSHMIAKVSYYNAFSISDNDVIHVGEFYENGREENQFWKNKSSRLLLVIKLTNAIDGTLSVWSVSDDYLPIQGANEHAQLQLHSSSQLRLLSIIPPLINSMTPIIKLASYQFKSVYYINTHHDSTIRKRCNFHF